MNMKSKVTSTKFALPRWWYLPVLLLGCMVFLQVAHADIPASERQVLLDLYQSTNGNDWTGNTGWNGPAGTECAWYGITCDAAGEHVTGIDLRDNNLSGSLPSSLQGLTNLEYFLVEDNHLSGPIPSLQGLANLRWFDGHNNQLSGAIPSLQGLTSLRDFYVSSNQLSGSIPSLQGLTSIGFFSVSHNQLTGTIPSLQGLTSLYWFEVGTNQLSGSIPSLQGLTSLQYFYVDNNQLSGSIPSLQGLTSLQSFLVNNNQLSGPMPGAPQPNDLMAGYSRLCPNDLNPTPDSDWDAATGITPWFTDCVNAPPTIEINPERLDVSLFAGNVLDETLTITNPGGRDLEWAIEDGSVSLELDDGGLENAWTARRGTEQFIFLNRFSPPPYEFPFQLKEVKVYLNEANKDDRFRLLVYENTLGSSDPANGAHLLYNKVVRASGGGQWNSFALEPPVLLQGPGDMLIGAIALETRGNNYAPIGFDTTTDSKRSWVGTWSGNPDAPEVPELPPNNVWYRVDTPPSPGQPHPGTLMIRGYGKSADCADPVDMPWLSVDPTSGTIVPGNSSAVTVGFDADRIPGTYKAKLCFSSNDPVRPVVLVPVTLKIPSISIGGVHTLGPAVGGFRLYSIEVRNAGADPVSSFAIHATSGVLAPHKACVNNNGKIACALPDTGVLTCQQGDCDVQAPGIPSGGSIQLIGRFDGNDWPQVSVSADVAAGQCGTVDVGNPGVCEN